MNPRLAHDVRDLQTKAWNHFAELEPALFSNGAVGISTSGSSGGAAAIGSIVVLSRGALENSAAAVNRRLRATEKDIWGLALPLFHVGGFSIPVRAEQTRSRVATFGASFNEERAAEPRAWKASDFHRWLVEEDVTLLSLVPTQLFDLVQAGLKSPPSLRAIVVGGGRLDETLHEKAKRLGWPVLQSYGLTECCSQVATALPESNGRDLIALDHVALRTDSNQKLWLRSASLLSAKIVFDDARFARLEKPVTDDGWFETSDRAVIENDRIQILGRDGESVKVVGELVDLVRVRSVVETLAAEAELGLEQSTWVVAIPNARREHELVLIVERKSVSKETIDAKVATLMGMIRRSPTKLAPFEMPTRILVVDQMPRSSLGKVLSTLLTEEAAKRFGSAP